MYKHLQTIFSNKKSTLYTLVVMAAFALCGLTAQAQELNARKHGSVMEQMEQSALHQRQARADRVQDILDYAFKFRGVPYRRGASSPRGFDCSGFTSYVFKRFGISLDRSSHGQIYDGRRVNRSELQPGDLVFFNGRAVGSRIGHVGIVTEVDKTGNGSFKFIHAASRGITESHSSEAYYARRYMGACRVVE